MTNTHRKASGLSLLTAALAVFTIGMGVALVTTAGPDEAPSNAARFMFEASMEGQNTQGACAAFLETPGTAMSNWASWGVNPAGIREMSRLMTEHCTKEI